ncbi:MULTISPECIES: hypothetical protein [unclassified Lysobacter]|nr:MULTISPECIES: hypothetical protein [unclassified Lysobacter]MBT2747668.1 hypothetical protein [Lysobacter sp. ISL-42]MBT2752851.1 hypothetical protein [Lysobacter sp. ISL-50]MBT2779735.1 hypothetical protein [Lysobacter sp. ISL-54]MBT2780086.1 hypothetical protein [Lysobacter sp. ISL-52]
MDTCVQYPLSSDDAPGRRAGDPGRGETSIARIGFDHMGGGDVDCEGDK